MRYPKPPSPVKMVVGFSVVGEAMRHRVMMLALLLAGCSSMPPFDAPQSRGGGPTVADVVAKIECEVAQAAEAPANADAKFLKYLHNHLDLQDFSQWAASVTISLTVNDTGGLNSTNGLTLSYLEPLSNPGTQFAFNGTAQFYQLRSRIFTQSYTLDMSHLSTKVCKRFDGKLPRINIAGDLGLRDQIYMGLHAFYDDESDYTPASGTNPAAASGTPDNFGATASFDVYKGATAVGPVWTFVHFIGPTGGVGYERDDLDKVAITFVPLKNFHASKALAKDHAAALAARSQSLAAARVIARTANAALVQNQAIQSLGQILSNRP